MRAAYSRAVILNNVEGRESVANDSRKWQLGGPLLEREGGCRAWTEPNSPSRDGNGPRSSEGRKEGTDRCTQVSFGGWRAGKRSEKSLTFLTPFAYAPLVYLFSLESPARPLTGCPHPPAQMLGTL